MAYTFTNNTGIRYIIDDTLIRKVNDTVLVLDHKDQMGDDLYINYYNDVKYYNTSGDQGILGGIIEVEGSGTELGSGDGTPVCTWNKRDHIPVLGDGETYHKIVEISDKREWSGTNAGSAICTIHNNNIYKYEFWIPDTVVNVDIDMYWIFHAPPTVHIGKKVKNLQTAYVENLVNDNDAVNTSLERLSNIVKTHGLIDHIKLRNCVNLDYIDILNDNVDSIDFYVDKKYKSLSKKKWTHDNCLVTDYRGVNSVGNDLRPLRKIDWKGLFNRSISDEADNFMCVQTDEAVVQIPLYIVQDGQSIDVDNALLIKEDDGVYYCPVTKEKTDKSIMAIQSTDCVYYIDSE